MLLVRQSFFCSCWCKGTVIWKEDQIFGLSKPSLTMPKAFIKGFNGIRMAFVTKKYISLPSL